MIEAAEQIKPTTAGASRRTLLHWSLLGPLILLAAEAAILTPQFEFTQGWMRLVAQPVLFNLAVFTLALLILICGDDLIRFRRQIVGHKWWLWLAVNLITYGCLYLLTRYLMRNENAGNGDWLGSLFWFGLAAGVGFSACVVFLPLSVLRSWLARHWEKAAAAAIVGVTLAILTPSIQLVWKLFSKHTLEASARMLSLAGHAGAGTSLHPTTGERMIGTISGKVVLVVTPACAEMESLATFGLLGVTVLVTGWFYVRKLRLVLILVYGIIMLYYLNAVRLFMLVHYAGWVQNPRIAVNLAHSRLSGIVFLGLSLLIMLMTRPLWYPRSRIADAPRGQSMADDDRIAAHELSET